MTDVVQLAKVAREHLASALDTLQSSGDLPDELLDIADPIAEAMSVFHRIERTRGEQIDGREDAYRSVRKALDLLQDVDLDHSALDTVIDSVAGSLAKARGLARYEPPPPPPPPAPEPVTEPAPPVVAKVEVAHAPVVAETPPIGAVAPSAEPVVVAKVADIAPAPEPVVAPAPQPMPVAAPKLELVPEPIAEPVALPEPVVAPEPVPEPAVAVSAPAVAPPPEPAPEPVRAPPAAEPAPAPRAKGPVVIVELGTRSASNFYKGLSGNDVVEHGGIFVATYKIPKIGTSVNLHVLMPGNYEFHAGAVVQWVRETRSGEAEPGFGARLVDISNEARNLVYRYARNREPLFYDDL